MAKKVNNRKRTNEDKQYVLQHYRYKSSEEISNNLGLSKQQVYAIVREERNRIDEEIKNCNDPTKAEELEKWKLENLPDKRGKKTTQSNEKSLINQVLQEELGINFEV